MAAALQYFTAYMAELVRYQQPAHAEEITKACKLTNLPLKAGLSNAFMTVDKIVSRWDAGTGQPYGGRRPDAGCSQPRAIFTAADGVQAERGQAATESAAAARRSLCQSWLVVTAVNAQCTLCKTQSCILYRMHAQELRRHCRGAHDQMH